MQFEWTLRSMPILLAVVFLFSSVDAYASGSAFPNQHRCQSGVIGSAFCVENVTTEGTLHRRSPIVQRDGGSAGLIGPWMLWTFGDTFGPYDPPDGHQRCYTAALSPPTTSGYRNLVDQTEGNGAPLQFVPLNDAENNFNFCARVNVEARPAWCNTVIPYPPRKQCDLSSGTCTEDGSKLCSSNGQCNAKCTFWGYCANDTTKPCTSNLQCSPRCDLGRGQCVDDRGMNCSGNNDCIHRLVLWPTRPIETQATNCENRSSPSCEGTGAVFYNKFLLRCAPGCFDWIEAGIARITLRANQVKTQGERDPTPVFSSAAGNYAWEPVIRENNYVYFMFDGRFARVKKAQIANSSQYQFWKKQGSSGSWSSVESDATKDPNYVNGDTVAWNPYIGRYLSARFSGADGIFVKFKDIYLQSASNIQGPWSPAVKIISTIPPPDENNYYAELHPEISGLGGREVRITWVRNNYDISQDIVAQKLTLLSLEDYATCGTITAPARASRGQRFNVSATLKNTGKRAWTNPDYHLIEGAAEGSTQRWGFGNVSLPGASVSPGASATFTFQATTPSNLRVGAKITVPFRLRHAPSHETVGKTCKFVVEII